MNNAREALAAIAALPLRREYRVLNLDGDQERVISLSDMRRMLPPQVHLLSGPGCAATTCPEADIYQAIRLVTGHPVTLLVADNLKRLPLNRVTNGPRTLQQAQLNGADVRSVSVPVEAVLAAEAERERQMIYFVPGFETLLAPLAGAIIDGLPPNLSVLLCGRRVEPLVEQHLFDTATGADALILPGHRCALTGTEEWHRLSADHQRPAAVAGYTVTSILSAIHAVLDQHCTGTVRVDNCYRPLVRAEGNALARDQLFRVFELVEGAWRGVGRVGGSAFQLRRAYDPVNADRRFPDYRGELVAQVDDMPEGCDCAAVMLGRLRPTDCGQFSVRCTPTTPYGPCMASEDGYCFLQRNSRNVA